MTQQVIITTAFDSTIIILYIQHPNHLNIHFLMNKLTGSILNNISCQKIVLHIAYSLHSYSRLRQFLLFRTGHWVTRFLHRCRSLAALIAPCQVRFVPCRSSLDDVRHGLYKCKYICHVVHMQAVSWSFSALKLSPKTIAIISLSVCMRTSQVLVCLLVLVSKYFFCVLHLLFMFQSFFRSNLH